MYLLYSFFLFLSFLFYIPVYFVKLKWKRKESLHMKERFGFGLKPVKEGGRTIWIHAVSVGEVLSLQNFIARLKKEHPDWKIYFSSLTNTGIEVARKKLPQADMVFYVPFDFKWVVRKFIRHLKPDIFILAESEFWPNMIREAERKTQGILLVNGRVSRRSFSRYQRLTWVTKRILKQISRFLVQTQRDKERLVHMGVQSACIEVAGNLKADIDLPVFSEKEKSDLKNELNIPEGVTLLLAGSIHGGEDHQVVEAFAEAKKKRLDLRMIIAPRHLDRAAAIERSCHQQSLNVTRKTQVQSGKNWEVLILDTMGELASLYSICDLAFLGGSLVPWGGQNFLEPAFYGKPVFFGPHMDNFQAVSELFLQEHAATVCADKNSLEEVLVHADREQLALLGKSARTALDSLRGAMDKTLAAVEELMNNS